VSKLVIIKVTVT